jgi:hypothetical protein
VTTLETGAPYVSCHAERTCRWGASDDTSNLVPCGDTPPDAGGSLACRAWQGESDLASSCELVGDCPADQQSYLDGLADPSTIEAVIGCGITWYMPSGGALGGSAFAFDAEGNLVGYDFWDDIAFGPCADEQMNEYERGGDLSDCAVVESCDLRDDRTPACR